MKSKKRKFKASQIPCDEVSLSYAAIAAEYSAIQKTDFFGRRAGSEGVKLIIAIIP